MSEIVKAWPLAWPIGWKRIEPDRRAAADFRRGNNASTRTRLTIAQGVDRVRDELRRMGVNENDVVVSTDVPLRLDGWPRSDQAEPRDPGAAVYWRKGDVRRVMAIDRYTRVADNLAAIAATLEAMRAIERHGGARILERAFTGFTALPAPGSERGWREVLGYPPQAIVTDEMLEARYRKLRSEYHPDKPGGSHAAFTELNVAYAAARAAIAA